MNQVEFKQQLESLSSYDNVLEKSIKKGSIIGKGGCSTVYECARQMKTHNETQKYCLQVFTPVQSSAVQSGALSENQSIQNSSYAKKKHPQSMSNQDIISLIMAYEQMEEKLKCKKYVVRYYGFYFIMKRKTIEVCLLMERAGGATPDLLNSMGQNQLAFSFDQLLDIAQSLLLTYFEMHLNSLTTRLASPETFLFYMETGMKGEQTFSHFDSIRCKNFLHLKNANISNKQDLQLLISSVSSKYFPPEISFLLQDSNRKDQSFNCIGILLVQFALLNYTCFASEIALQQQKICAQNQSKTTKVTQNPPVISSSDPTQWKEIQKRFGPDSIIWEKNFDNIICRYQKQVQSNQKLVCFVKMLKSMLSFNPEQRPTFYELIMELISANSGGQVFKEKPIIDNHQLQIKIQMNDAIENGDANIQYLTDQMKAL